MADSDVRGPRASGGDLDPLFSAWRIEQAQATDGRRNSVRFVIELVKPRSDSDIANTVHPV